MDHVDLEIGDVTALRVVAKDDDMYLFEPYSGEETEITEDKLRELKETDVLSELLTELGQGTADWVPNFDGGTLFGVSGAQVRGEVLHDVRHLQRRAYLFRVLFGRQGGGGGRGGDGKDGNTPAAAPSSARRAACARTRSMANITWK